MVWFKCGLLVLPSTYILSLCSHVVKENKSFENGLIFLYVASGAIASKILYDRFQQVNILGSLTPNPNVTGFANKIATASACLLSLGFPVYLIMFGFKVDNYCLTALNICLCAFATLYMWMQGILTVYFSTLYYDKDVQAIRRCLASFASIVLVVMAIFGTISTFLPDGTGTTSGVYICLYITTLCGYILAAFFGVFILSFEKDYKHFAGECHSDSLLDNECSTESLVFPTNVTNPDSRSCYPDSRASYRPSPVRANTTLIKSAACAARHS